MRTFRTSLFLFVLFFICFKLPADPLHCFTNDTLTSKESDPHQLFKFLVGTWAIQGTWQVTEGKGKVKYTARASLKGTETYQPILNGHFLERKLNTNLSYFSRDYGKKMSNSYSALSIYSYNQNMDQFLAWSFDCSGTHLASKGYYNSQEQAYQFNDVLVSESGEEIKMLHSIIYVNENEFRWEVQQKDQKDYEWTLAASGTATRKKKS